MKKYLALIFMVLILFVCVSTAFAEVVASGDCGKYGDNLKWDITKDGEKVVLTIRKNGASGEMEDFRLAPWKEYSFGDVVIEPGVETVGSWAFTENQNIGRIVLPDSLSSIGSYAFAGCERL